MADPLADFAQQVRQALEQARERLGWQVELPALETPPAGQADLALPCFPLAKALRQAPAQIAQTLRDALPPPQGLLRSATAVNGYLNFEADPSALAARVVPAALAEGRAYGSLPDVGRSLVLEHTSANPTGPLHVGRARNPIIGDTLARVLRKAGWRVESQYYLDDVGKQVAILAWGRTSLKEADVAGADEPGPDRYAFKAGALGDHRSVRYYQVANQRMETDAQVAAQIQELVQKSEVADPETMRALEAGYAPILDGMFASMQTLGIRFDSVVKESTFIENGATEDVIARLQATHASRQEEDGALYLDLAAWGIAGRNQRFVYRRRDGTSLYATRDVAYHLWKAGRADRLVNVLGEDHKLQAQQVRISLELLGCKALPEVVFYAFVTLPEGRMSTRKGRVVYLDDLLEEAFERAYEEVRKRRGQELEEVQLRSIAQSVGVGALRYNIVRVQPEKAITFRWEEALNFEGASGPFLQYAYARCASMLRRAETVVPPEGPETAAHASEAALVRAIARLPRVVDEAAARAAPHTLAQYAQDLAGALNAFYRDCPVLNAPPEVRGPRLRLVAAARNALGSTLDLLGIPVLEEM